MDVEGWEPWTAEEIDALLDEDVAALSKDETASFALVRVTPRTLALKSGVEEGQPTHWVVAERADKVLYWDSVAEEYGVTRLKAGVPTELESYGDLSWALDELFGQKPPEEPKEHW
jgi:hypothetical protein